MCVWQIEDGSKKAIFARYYSVENSYLALQDKWTYQRSTAHTISTLSTVLRAQLNTTIP